MRSSREDRSTGQRVSTVSMMSVFGGLPERPKGADCKSAGYAFDGSNPSPSTGQPNAAPKKSSRRHTASRADALYQTDQGQEENAAGVAQLVERQPSKLNVAGSNPVSRSRSEHGVRIGTRKNKQLAQLAQW